MQLEMIALIGVSAILCGICALAVLHHRKQRQLVDVLQLQLAALSQSEGRQVYLWHARSGAVMPCNSVARAGLPARSQLITDLLAAWEEESRPELEHCLATLQQDRRSFSTRVRTVNQQDTLRISGAELNSQRGYYVISIDDATADIALEAQLKSLEGQKQQNTRLFDQLPYPVWLRNAEGQLVYLNEAFVKLAGKVRERLVAENHDLLTGKAYVPGEDATTPLQRTMVVAGERRLMSFFNKPFPDGGSYGYGIDVTEIEQAQSELVRHITAHNDVLEFLSTGIAVYGPDTRLQYFNNAYALLIGNLAQLLRSKPTLSEVLDALHEHRLIPEFADFAAYKKKQIEMFTTLTSPMHELLHLPDDRTIRMVTAPHPLGGLLFMFEDVTDVLTLERQYNTLIAVQKATLDHLHEGVAVFSSDNRLKLSNPSFQRIWNLKDLDLQPGKALPALLDQTKDLFYHGNAWEKIRERIIGSITNRITKSGQIKRRDGSVLTFSYVPLPDGANMLSYLDISDSYRVEHALRERTEALEETDRLKAEFIANVSYELRAPLNTVIGFTEILINQYFGELNHRQIEYSQGILDSSKQLLTLINGILDLASMEAGRLILKREIINIPYLLRTVFNLLEKKAREHGHELTCNCSPAVDNMIGDERQLKQVIYNLVVNAIKFTPSGGKIHINAEIEPDNVLCIYVEDNGLGIPAEDHERVFGKFERIEHFPNVGAGLGLALVKSFVEMHRGTITMRSAPNEGTRVTCRIPLQPIEVLENHQSFPAEDEVGEPMILRSAPSSEVGS